MSLICWAIAILTLVFIPFKIASFGLIPAGDARRHIAMAFTERTYPEILVMRPEYRMSHNAGWEALLRAARRAFALKADALAAFGIVATFGLLLLIGLPWFRRPEAWLAAWLAQFLAVPEMTRRLTQARPFIITEAVVVGVLLAWSRPTNRKYGSVWLLAATVAGIALSTWMHGAWYLWAIPVAAFVLARRWNQAVALIGCIIAGVIAGAVLTGKPVTFLMQALDIARIVSKEQPPTAALVGEFRPMDGNFTTLVLLALVMIWRRVEGLPIIPTGRALILIQVAIAWILGLQAERSWSDWGLPAVIVLIALQIQDIIKAWLDSGRWSRVLLTLALAVPLYIQVTADRGGRYTYSNSEIFLDAKRPDLKGWVPDPGGIFYTADLTFFFNTFYQNPDAPYRYILGMEPALMPPDDLKTYRHLQETSLAVSAFQPWIKKMRPADRLVIGTAQRPPIPELEWKRILGNNWIGRLPRAAN